MGHLETEVAERDHHEDRIRSAWQQLGQRYRTVLELRIAGETLEQVGASLGVTRERVRQVQLRAESAFLEAVEAQLPELGEELLATVGAEAAVPDHTLQETFRTTSTTSTTASIALLRGLGIVRPRTWAGDLEGWWTRRQNALDVQLRNLAAQAPFSAAKLHERAKSVGLPEDLPFQELFTCRQSPLMPGPAAGWVRRSTKGTDAAFLWLANENHPRSSDKIAEAAGWPSKRSLHEALRRDGRFAQLRPMGTWVLSEWETFGDRRQYSSAFEALVEVLRERGPLTFDQLAEETIGRYPVSRSWINECLSSKRVGRTEEGMYDLVERGALASEDREPRKPDNIVESPSGQMIAVRLRVGSELLRGSSVTVSKWLTWRLGLRQVPSEKHFALRELAGDVVLRRTTGTLAVSSLRAAAQSLGLKSGCQIVVVLRPEHDTADIRHGCIVAQCPSGQR